MPKTVTVPSTLSGKAAIMWRATFLDAFNGTCSKPKKRRGGSEVSRDACAARIAWGVVKKSYKKSAGGNWVSKASDPVVGPVSPVPDASEAPAFGAGYDLFGPGQNLTKIQRWKRAFALAMSGECRNADHPVECARAKANAAVGRTDTNVEPIAKTIEAPHKSLNMGSFNDYTPAYVERREFDTAKRREMAKAGTAMPDGSFPISNCEDVSNAVGSLGRTSKPKNEVVAHIRKRANKLGCGLTPALEQKVVVIERYLKRIKDRDLANQIDYQHIESFEDTPIERPENISSAVWRSLPAHHRTVRAEATRRIIERNYAQAVEDSEMTGWTPRVNQYHPEEYYFIKAWPTRDNGDVMIRSILVRVADSLDWSLMQMSSFASGSIAEMLPAGIFRHTNNHRKNLPLINKAPNESGVSLPDAASGEAGRQKLSETRPPATTEQTKEILYGNDPDIPVPMDERKQLEGRLREMNLGQIAGEIRKDWKNVSFGAVPYLEAMASLESIDDKYFMDSGVSVVSFFLSNSGNWRGDTARAVRAELNRRIKRT